MRSQQPVSSVASVIHTYRHLPDSASQSEYFPLVRSSKSVGKRQNRGFRFHLPCQNNRENYAKITPMQRLWMALEASLMLELGGDWQNLQAVS